MVAQCSYQNVNVSYSQNENVPSLTDTCLPSRRMIRYWDPATDTLNDFHSCRGDGFSPDSSAKAPSVLHTTRLADDLNKTGSQPERMRLRVGSTQNSSSVDSANRLGVLQQPMNSINDVCGEQTSIYPTFHEADIDWSTFLNLSPEIQSSDETPGPAMISSEHSSPRESLPYEPTSRPLQEHGTTSQLILQADSRSRSSLARRSISSSITLEGANPEDIVSPLQALESKFPMHLVRHDLEGYRYSDSHLSSLLEIVNSTWLHLEIEDLLCWSYEMSARTLRERQASRQDYNSDIHSEKSYNASNHDRDPWRPDAQEVHNSQVFPSAKPKLMSFLMREMPSSTLKTQLWTELSADPEDFGNPEPHSWLTISFITRGEKRSKGLTVELTTAQRAFHEPRICPRIKAFNVVPENSEVIRCVSRNDLRGLQKLFDNREASPLDVDPRGYSLLSASLTCDCLVRNGDPNSSFPV